MSGVTTPDIVDVPLFVISTPTDGPVAVAAAGTLQAYADAGALELGYDGLLIAHVISLASRLDNPGAPAYGLAAVSRELREVYRDLEARRRALAGPGPGAAGLLLGDDGDDD